MQERFNKQFVDKDTGLLNIGKYDHDEVIKFITKELLLQKSDILNTIYQVREDWRNDGQIQVLPTIDYILRLIQSNETT